MQPTLENDEMDDKLSSNKSDNEESNQGVMKCEVGPNGPQLAISEEVGSDGCRHNWDQDGQTLTSVRFTCSKCGKTMLC